jgi:hypothetical protein
MELPKNDHTLYAGNEVLHMDFQDITKSNYNGVVVTSTGDPNLYKVERSLRRGISYKQTVSFFDVCHLALEMHALGAVMLKNFVFKNGIDTAIQICNTEFEKKAAIEGPYANAKARIHEEWESLKIGDKEYKRGAGVGVDGPTGKIYEVTYP